MQGMYVNHRLIPNSHGPLESWGFVVTLVGLKCITLTVKQVMKTTFTEQFAFNISVGAQGTPCQA